MNFKSVEDIPNAMSRPNPRMQHKWSSSSEDAPSDIQPPEKAIEDDVAGLLSSNSNVSSIQTNKSSHGQKSHGRAQHRNDTPHNKEADHKALESPNIEKDQAKRRASLTEYTEYLLRLETFNAKHLT